MPVPTRKRVRFPLPRGVVAAPASAWGQDFDVLIAGGHTQTSFLLEGPYAVVDICGPLLQRADWVFDGYDGIRGRVELALASEASAVVLRIDSPGGDFPGGLEVARELRAMAAAKGKRLIAFTDSQALSAGYGLACACDEIVMTPSAYVGSVGVWAALADITAADRMAGTNVVIVPSGERKADRNPHVAITSDTIAALQVEVDAMAQLFFGLVAEVRGLSVAAVEGYQGAMIFGSEAISKGLADRVVNSWSEFINTPQGNTKETAMPEDMRKALAKAAEDGDEKAARALKAWDEDGDDKEKGKAAAGDGDGDGDDKKASAASAKAEEDKKETEEKEAKAKKAKAEEEEKEKAKKAAAAAQSATVQSLAAELHAMKAAAASEKEATERAKLLAGRPDISGTVRDSLNGAPIEFVRNACATWPRVKDGKSAAAQTPGGTRGAAQVDDGETPLAELPDDAFIARKMQGAAVNNDGVVTRRNGRELVLGFMSPKDVEAAAARLAKKEGV